MNNLKRIIGSGKPLVGSKSPGIGYLYVLVIMFIAIAAGTLLSGGFVPVDPNGTGGPPTLEPYFDQNDYGKQKIILPSGAMTPDPRGNLQLKTFTVNTCGQKTAILFVIDTSGSMSDDGKMQKTQEALRAFTKNLPGKTALGMITFSAQVQDRVPLDYYKNQKGQVAATITGLHADGWTTTRSALSRAKQILSEAITQNKFPGYKYSLVLMTDGVPEIPQFPDQPKRQCIKEVYDPIIGGLRCFSVAQDPRVPTNLAKDIQNLGIGFYTIGIYSENSSDKQLKPYLEQLLKEISSQPLSTHYYSSPKADNLTKIFDDLVSNICDAQGQ
jgi:hypothetical protein